MKKRLQLFVVLCALSYAPATSQAIPVWIQPKISHLFSDFLPSFCLEVGIQVKEKHGLSLTGCWLPMSLARHNYIQGEFRYVHSFIEKNNFIMQAGVVIGFETLITRRMRGIALYTGIIPGRILMPLHVGTSKQFRIFVFGESVLGTGVGLKAPFPAKEAKFLQLLFKGSLGIEFRWE